MYIIDTNAVIYYLSGEDAIVALIAKTQEQGDIVYVPTIVRLELLSKPDMTQQDNLASEILHTVRLLCKLALLQVGIR